jgi:8-oxo-dGTP pyrophosphatase MutT (NUDIX family)
LKEIAMSEIITFGIRREGVQYRQRRAVYAVVGGANGTVAAVKGPSGRFWLPGGGSLRNETAEETIVREVREELARSVRLIRKLGEVTQYFYAARAKHHYEMLAVFFAAEFPDQPSGQGEYELHWLPVAEAEEAFFHASHAWAVRQA